ncbi:hypothetical protein Taro_027422, partial [Colocasia esculenta]|nr:hypothetical protein [Colocasia esculenta]
GGVARHDDGGGGAGGAKLRRGALLGVKVRRGLSIAKRDGPCTPAPAWKLEAEEHAGPSRGRDEADFDAAADGDRCRVFRSQHRGRLPPFPFPAAVTAGTAAAAVSARKLGADLWEFQASRQRSRMSRKGTRSRHFKGEKLADLPDLSPLVLHEPQSAGSLRRHLSESLIQRHKSADRSDHALQPVSPACYSSSMEVAAYNLAVTPTSSLDLKRRPGCNFKTSTELLKVLNRIWSLEEQHASNVSVVKTLKFELEHAQARIHTLLKDKQSDRREIDDLVKQIAEEKLLRKSNEQERINAAVQSIRDELEEERMLRRHSESLHRKLAKDFSDVKLAFSRAVKELEREKKAHRSLHYLCDEFAKGIRDYEEEVRELKHRSGRDHDLRSDRPVLHISEAWMDERLQMKKAEAQGDVLEINMIMNRLMCEIESFLEARQPNCSIDDVSKEGYSRRHSLESVHLNGAISAPRDVEDVESVASDLHCLKPNMGTSATESHGSLKVDGAQSVEKVDEARKSSLTWKVMKSSERPKCQNSSIAQVKLKAHAQPCKKGKIPFIKRVQGIHARNMSMDSKDASQVDVLLPQISENGEVQEDGEHTDAKQDCAHGSSCMVKNTCSKPELGQIYRAQPGDVHVEGSCNSFPWRRQSLTVDRDSVSGDYWALSSPVQQWSCTSANPGVADCLSELPDGMKENTLKAKLLEARLQVHHARLKASRGSPVGE